MDLREAERGFSEDIQSGDPSSVLAGLFSQILRDLRIDDARFENFAYDHSRRISKTDNLKKISSTYGNLINRFNRGAMSWNVFVKGVSLLGARRMEIIITLRTMDNRETVAAYVLEFSPEVVYSDDKMNYAQEALPCLLKTIQANLGISKNQISDLIRKSLLNTVPGADPSIDAINKFRSSFNKELNSDKISWKSFIRALMVFEVAIFDIDVRLTHNVGAIQTVHGRKVVIDQNYNP